VTTVKEAVIPSRNLTELLKRYYMIGRSPTSKTFSSKRFTLCCDLTIPRIPLAVLTSYKSGYLYGDDKDGLEEKSDGVARRQPEEDSENV